MAYKSIEPEVVEATEDENGYKTWTTAAGQVTVFDDGEIYFEGKVIEDEDLGKASTALVDALWYSREKILEQRRINRGW